MKREYRKPYFEAGFFQVDAAIAGCSSVEGRHPLNHDSETTCTAFDRGVCTENHGRYFNDTTRCDIDAVNEGWNKGSDCKYDGTCYQGFANGAGLTFLVS